MSARTNEIHANTTLLRWGAVFGGGLIGLAVFALLSTFFGALAAGSDVGFIADSITWWIGGSAIFSLFLAGMLAGWMAGPRGTAAGVLNGMAVWALGAVLSAFGAVPGLAGMAQFDVTAGDLLWVQFWSLLIGFGAAAIGGLIGGALPQPASRELTVDSAHGFGHSTEQRPVDRDRDRTDARHDDARHDAAPEHRNRQVDLRDHETAGRR